MGNRNDNDSRFLEEIDNTKRKPLQDESPATIGAFYSGRRKRSKSGESTLDRINKINCERV